jgi:hypothetical protein
MTNLVCARHAGCGRGYFSPSAAQALVLIHPTVTMTMIKLFSCTPVLGYRKTWLAADVRYQCNDSSWLDLAISTISVIIIFTIGLPC